MGTSIERSDLKSPIIFQNMVGLIFILSYLHPGE